MNNSIDISVLLLDIGGVLLTNGWDRAMRRRAADAFDLDLAELGLGLPEATASGQPVERATA